MEKREYMPWLFSEQDRSAFADLRAVFDPAGVMNPGKLLPTGDPAADPGRALVFRRAAEGGAWI